MPTPNFRIWTMTLLLVATRYSFSRNKACDCVDKGRLDSPFHLVFTGTLDEYPYSTFAHSNQHHPHPRMSAPFLFTTFTV